ncbi:DUF3823 domain-containing protein [Saccharicrinis sp. FJH54]|uniref:DUF3823 domain-containing protein n=1 Tax=Saccharicrinis sp. FJH54 TaxID=3344665 RepID=UPI0035D41072
MKIKLNYILVFIVSILFYNCEVDNYAPPKAILQGKLMVGDKPLQTQEGYMFELWQPQYTNPNKINVHINQDGEFNALLFDGYYEIIPGGESLNAPWIWSGWENTTAEGIPDTIAFNLSGEKALEVQVIPYYEFKTISFSFEDNYLIAAVEIEKLVNDTDIPDGENATKVLGVALNIGLNVTYDPSSPIASKRGSVNRPVDISSPLELKIDMAKYYSSTYTASNYRKYLFARLSIKTNKSNDVLLFSNVIKVDIPDEVYNLYH